MQPAIRTPHTTPPSDGGYMDQFEYFLYKSGVEARGITHRACLLENFLPALLL